MQVAFFSATLHSPEIQELGKKLCFYPIWVDLKGKDSIPDYVHHAVYRVHIDDRGDAKRSPSSGGNTSSTCKASLRNVQTFTDNVHSAQGKGKRGLAELNSQILKETKQKLLLDIVDKFQVF